MGILPRRNKIRSIKLQIKDIVAEINDKNNVTYTDPKHTWATSGGALNTNLYHKGNLHLTEKINEKLAKAITTALNVGSCNRNTNTKINNKNYRGNINKKT